jgi:hypothetical protein
VLTMQAPAQVPPPALAPAHLNRKDSDESAVV